MLLLLGFSLTMTLVPGGSKGVLLKSKFPSIIACAETLEWVLKAWECPTWYLLALVVFPIVSLVTSCQSHLYPIQKGYSMSWYPSPYYFFCACKVVPIGSLSGFFYQSFYIVRRTHYLASEFLVDTLFLLGKFTVWIMISSFIVWSNSWGYLLILCWYHGHKGVIYTFFCWFDS